MQVAEKERGYVLALYPHTRGLAYVLFESPLSIIDWGTTSQRHANNNEFCVALVKRLVERYSPEVIVLEDGRARNPRRCARIKLLATSLHVLACVQGTEVARLRARDVGRAFEKLGAKTMHERSRAIARMIPALSHRLPPPRKIWQSLDPRFALFEAAALGLAYYGESVEA